jgi:putative transposase
LEDLSRVPAETKAAVMQIVEQSKRRSGWQAYRTLVALGVPRSVFYAWKKRESLDDRVGKPCRVYEVVPEERAAICEFALQYPKIGYRKLTWMMIDAETACVGESTVYRVLSDADLLSRWKRSTVSSGEYNFRPPGPNQQWHTDLMYVWVTARFYFLLSFVDAYSRYIVHHKLLISLDGQSVALELQAALEAPNGAKPRVVHDHGSEFVNRDVAAVIKTHNLIDIRTKPRHPESNGIVERFNGTVRDESNNDYGGNYLQAEAIIAKLMQQYNEERLLSALVYLCFPWLAPQPRLMIIVGSPSFSLICSGLGVYRTVMRYTSVTLSNRQNPVDLTIVALRTHQLVSNTSSNVTLPSSCLSNDSLGYSCHGKRSPFSPGGVVM